MPDKPIDPEGPLPISPGSEEGLQARLTLIVNKPRKAPPKDFVPVPYTAARCGPRTIKRVVVGRIFVLNGEKMRVTVGV